MKCSAERTRSKWKSRIRTIIVVNRIRLKNPQRPQVGALGFIGPALALRWQLATIFRLTGQLPPNIIAATVRSGISAPTLNPTDGWIS
jgi:hypothetical protein